MAIGTPGFMTGSAGKSHPGDDPDERIPTDRARLRYVDKDGRAHEVALPATHSRIIIGRSPRSDVAVTWDPEVSGLHAIIEWTGTHWIVADQMLSRNGTFVNGVRMTGRRRLVSGDRIRVGSTSLMVEGLPSERARPTACDSDGAPRRSLTPTEAAVLIALCRPYMDNLPYPMPAPNPEIAHALGITVHTVRTHLRTIYEEFGIDDEHLNQNQKRVRLVERAMQTSFMTDRDL